MFTFSSSLSGLLLLSTLSHHVTAITLDLSSTDSIKAAAATAAYNMMTYYTGNRTGDVPGMLPDPYYWWEAGAMWMTLVEYWYYTGDTTYNDAVSQALLFQVGTNNDYMPANETKSEGNDDQVFWAFAAMSAAELKFPDPPSTSPQWLALAQAVFNEQAVRWDSSNCGGGLRWQIYTFNTGYNYKNTISNGGFFQLAARLARYTGNSTYASWAEKAYDWMASSPLVVESTDSIKVNDGTSIENQCADADQLQWTYNYGTMISGAAYMYNYTNGSSTWNNRLGSLLNNTAQFFISSTSNTKVMSEIACEAADTCDTDQPSFKAYLSRWLAIASQLAPAYHDTIMVKLQASATAAATACTGGTVATNGGNTIDGTTCGRKWSSGSYDGSYGVGESMSALAIFGSTLIDQVDPPYTAVTGGTSQGDPSAGSDDTSSTTTESTITQGDKVAAGFLTAFLLIFSIGGAVWLIV